MAINLVSIRRIAAAFLTLAIALVQPALGQTPTTFGSPEAAVAAFVEAVKSGQPAEALVTVLGPAGRDLAISGDPTDDEARRARFLSSFEEGHSLQAEGNDRVKLVISKDEYPFPIPIVKKGETWQWDVDAGLDEILTRRIGENELAAIEVMWSYVAAQREYAEQPRDGKGIQYARRLMSREGRKDGLYWEVTEGEPESPIGPLIAKAQREGYVGNSKRSDGQRAYHGYVYRMLYGQGRNAADGPRDYILNDRMIGGFALIAVPLDYGNSGVMTFIVNQDGDVFQKDLGLGTTEAAARIKLFDPDGSWQKVSSD
jgi:hypothetical protein